MCLHKYTFIILLIAGLSGCATMSKDECLQADWYLKGLDDATQGFALDRVVEHGKACSRVNITPDMRAYRQGHGKGARLYCTVNKGYSVGRKGDAYNGICPNDLEQNFLRAYHDGQELFQIESNINHLHNEIEEGRRNIESNYHEIQHLQYEIADRNSNPNERFYKLNRIGELQDDIRRTDRRIDNAAREIELFEHDYDIVADKHRRMGYMP